MSEDRIDRLERRVAVLEQLLRERGAPVAPDIESATIQPAPTPAPARTRPVWAPSSEPAPEPVTPTPTRDTEQWVGQRGLLAVGVILMVLAVSYLVKLAIDRGWISPAMRCIGAAVTGVGIGLGGWRFYQRDLRTYGASLIGLGGAFVYVGVWAAARLFGLILPFAGIAGLAIVSLVIAAIAYLLAIESLAAVAAVGALVAPMVVVTGVPDAQLLFVYTSVVALSLGWATVARNWRMTTDLVALIAVVLPLTAVSTSTTPRAVLAYGVIGGVIGQIVAARRQWHELRVVGFLGGWAFIALAATQHAHPLLTLLGSFFLADAIIAQTFSGGLVVLDDEKTRDGRVVSTSLTLCFYLTPILFWSQLSAVAPSFFAAHLGAPAALVALPFLAVGMLMRRVPFAFVGAIAAVLAAWTEWNNIHATWALMAIAVAWLAFERWSRRPDARWFAIGTLLTALIHLAISDLRVRGDTVAFLDPWAITLWIGIIIVVGCATMDWHTGFSSFTADMPGLLWSAGGLLLFFGVNNELSRFVEQRGWPQERVRLAGGLAISAWWTVYAGGLVAVGFYRNLKAVRIAGLLVAGVAVIKVITVDLAMLDALYRVASVLILGIVSLGVAYVYNRRAKEGGVNE